MISAKRVYWDNLNGCFSFAVPTEGFLICIENGEVPREFWESLTGWLAEQKTVKTEKQTKSVKPVEDK